MTENSEEFVIETKLGTLVDVQAPSVDPFDVSAEMIKSFDDLNLSLKRKAYRKIEKFNKGANGAESKRLELYEDTGYSLFDVVVPPYNLNYLAQLYDISPAHHASVDVKAANIIGLGFDFVISDKVKQSLSEITDEEKIKKVNKKIAAGRDKLFDTVDSWNEEDEFIETLLKVYVDYESTGNGYLEIGRTNAGDIGYVGHIPSSQVRVRKSRDGYVQILFNKAVYFRNFGDKKTKNPVSTDTEPNEIIHFKKYSPIGSYYGVPDIIAAKNAIAGNEFASRYNLDYFEYKAVPRYVIIAKGSKLSAPAQRDLLEFFQGGLKGKNHRTIFIPLPADTPESKVSFEMKPVETNIQDLSFDKYINRNNADIFMAHRVPISKVSTAESTALAAAADADKTFKELVCNPQQLLFNKKIQHIFEEITDAFEFKLNELTLTDEESQAKIDELYLRTKVIVPNEVRARKGLQGLKGGDKPVELTAAGAAEQRAQTNGNRQRDSQRRATAGTPRNPKGAGGKE